tara:strand:+ start:1323 stop:1790 length:468 start_codon:yes stop_codon:yes gene_type:complete
MHKTILIITTGENELEALENADEFADRLVADDSGHDYHSPLRFNSKPEDSGYFFKPKSIDDPYSTVHLITLLNESKARSLEWMRLGIDELNRMDFDQARISFSIATSSETFHVFDYTEWSHNGSPVYDTIELNKILEWSKDQEIKLWVTGLDVHF